jgi:hypothetical protein
MLLALRHTPPTPTSSAMCFGCLGGGGSSGGVREPLNSRVSDDVSIQSVTPKPTIISSNQAYEPPPRDSPRLPAAPPVEALPSSPPNNEKGHQDFTSLPIPEKGEGTTLTGWLFYRTGNLITSYEKGFFVLEEGYLYIYNQPKRSAASEKGLSSPHSLTSHMPSAAADLARDAIDLAGAILTKVALPDRQFCLEIENNLFIDARTAAAQVLWINALIAEIDTASLNCLLSGDPKARDAMTLWFGKLLGRKQNCITILQQSFTVVSPLLGPLPVPPSLPPCPMASTDEALHEGRVPPESHEGHESRPEWR